MKALAVVAVLLLATLVPHAQRGRGQPQQKPADLPLTDPKRVAFEMEDNLGLLRGMQQTDALKRIEYWGTTGTIDIQGKSTTLTKFKVSIDYDVPAMRFDFTHDGRRDVQVVADKFAWNEDTPGGTAIPMPAMVNDRLLQVWLTPVGLAKMAAKAAADGTAKLSTELGVPSMTFPVPGATVKAALNKFYQSERVEAQVGATTLDISYTDYGDWNDDAPADIFLPRHIVQKRGGSTLLDLTVATTNTYNPYVIFPIPNNVGKAAPPR